MSCSGCTPIPSKPFINNQEFELIREIELEENKLIKDFNNNYKYRKEINLSYLSQYFLNPKRDKLESKYFNQIIMITGKDINPFELINNNNDDINKDKSKSKEIITKYENKIIPISSHLNLNQHIFPDYYYTI